ncbi:hypothetical protein GGTG_08332 [Gaeumannomyces tritici R3-111a-1]|uniref:Uncharacterized protein n=1 Tax=Gaeumannomyces tritici (strain R3-111a-1) TaxID=644352 RepID=J3P496_GAET3|nr:hypothetical protein GGTG_08332 [Gaeumannomyces tritici R3-111a-1]EJT74492.1 hypothetical protein GGTG_08332 [Gaeumannomyces tritici R3-111a-1]
MFFSTAELTAFSGSILDRVEFLLSILLVGALCLTSLFLSWACQNPGQAKKLVLPVLPAMPAWAPTRQSVIISAQLVALVLSMPLFVGLALVVWTFVGVRQFCRSGGSLAASVYAMRTVDLAKRAGLDTRLADLIAKRNGLVDAINVTCLLKRRELLEDIASFQSGIWYALRGETCLQQFLDQAEWLKRIDVPRVTLVQATRRLAIPPGRFAAFLYRYDYECAILEHKIGRMQEITDGLSQQLRDYQEKLSKGHAGLEGERLALRKVVAELKKWNRLTKEAGIRLSDPSGTRASRSDLKVRFPVWERKLTAVDLGPSSRKVGKLVDVGASVPIDMPVAPVLPSGCTPAVASSTELVSTVDDTMQMSLDSSPAVGQEQPPTQQQQQVLPVQATLPATPALPAPPVQLALPSAPMPQAQPVFSSMVAQLRLATENRKKLEAEHRSRVQFEARLEATRRSYQQAQHERDMAAQRQHELAVQARLKLDRENRQKREMDAQAEQEIPALTELLSSIRIEDPVVAALPLAASPVVVAAAPCCEIDMVVDDEVEAVPTPVVSEPEAMEVAQPDEDASSAAPITNLSSTATAPGPSVEQMSFDELPLLPEEDDEDYLNQDVPVTAGPSSSKLPVIEPVASSSTAKHTVPAVPAPLYVDYGNVQFDLSVPCQGQAPPPSAVGSTFGAGGLGFSGAFLASAGPSVPTASVVVPSAKGKEVVRAPAAEKVEPMSPPAPALVIDDQFLCPRLLNDDDIKEMDDMLEEAIREMDEQKAGGESSSSSAQVPVTPAPKVSTPAVSFAATVDAQDQAVWESLADIGMDQEVAASAPAVAPRAPVQMPKAVPGSVKTPKKSSIPPPGQRPILVPRRRNAVAAAAPPAAQPQVSPPAAPQVRPAPPPAQQQSRAAPLPVGQRPILVPRRRNAVAAVAPPAAQQQEPPQQALQQAPLATASNDEPRERLEAHEMAALRVKTSRAVSKLARSMLAEAFEHHLKASNECTADELRAARNNIRDSLDEIMSSFQPAVAGTYECSDCDAIMAKWVHQHLFSSGRVAEAERKLIDSMKKGANGAPGKFRRRYLRFAGWAGC